METALDFLSSVHDEIALEGLDGITLSTLWIRLQNRPHFPLALDDGSKEFLWECVAVNEDIEIFQLPKPRPTLQLFNRYDYIDPELGIVMEPDKPVPDIYPLVPVDDGVIKGSCSTYETRKCITSNVRHNNVLLISLKDAFEKWGDALVLVASPKSRLLALIGSEVNPLIQLNIEPYCLLERIGRSRYAGEVTQGDNGILALKECFVKHLHYFCSKLISKGLITKQKHFLRNRNGQTLTGTVLHLTRFYVQRKTKMQSLIEYIQEILQKKPGHQEVSKVLRTEVGVTENTFKKLLKSCPKLFKYVIVPFKEVHPNATEDECKTCKGDDRMIKVVQLNKSNVEEEEIEKVGEGDEDDSELKDGLNIYFDPRKILYDVPLLDQIYSIVETAGPSGVTAQDIGKAITIPRLEIRTMLRQLIKNNMVISIMQDRGRQRVSKYIAKKLELESKSCNDLKEQQKMFLNRHEEMLNIKNENASDSSNINFKLSNKSIHMDYIKEAINLTANQVKSQTSDCGDVNITAEIIEAEKVKLLKNPVSKQNIFSGETMESNIFNTTSTSKYASPRVLKRANLMLRYLKQAKLATIIELQKFVHKEERKEGYKFRMDKRSTLRILTYLSKSEHIKILSTSIKVGNKLKELQFVCDPSFHRDDPYLKYIIDQVKFRCSSKSEIEIAKKVIRKSAKSNASKVSKSLEKKSLTKENKMPEKSEKIFSPTVGRRLYGLQPRFIRLKTLHMFLFYLTRDYEGIVSTESEQSCVYHESYSWKRYIPPLPDYSNKGWCLLADVIARMPLSVFVKVINIRYIIPDLEESLKDNDVRHLLLKQLPQNLKYNLIGNRSHIFAIHELINQLCYMGLVSFGPKIRVVKEQVYIYVHKKAKIKDTTASPACYLFIDSSIPYEIKEYTFETNKDVETYWIDLEMICLRTPLGKYGLIDGEGVTIVDLKQKPQMIETIKNRNMEDIVDDGAIPGDGLGAGGYDSSFFFHLRRNWHWINTKLPEKSYKSDELNNLTQEKCPLKILIETGSSKCNFPVCRKRLQRLAVQDRKFKSKTVQGSKLASTVSVKSTEKVNVEKKKKKKIKLRLPRKAKKRIRIPYYDEKDKEAMRRMSKLRCDWYAQEDSFLLLCKVASMFLDPKCIRLVVPCTVIRDMLHERFPNLSLDKTSRACQRRLRHMITKNPETRSNINVNLEEVKQDFELVREFDVAKPPKTREAVWKRMFTSVVDKLIKKFTISAEDRCQKINLPDNLDTFYERYEIKKPSNIIAVPFHHIDPQCHDDIYSGVLYTVIMSSIPVSADNENWNYILYKLYQQYPDNLLMSVVKNIANERLITKKRYAKLKWQLTRHSSLPYRFTVTYEHAFITKYPNDIYSGAKRLLDEAYNENNFSKVYIDDEVSAGYTATILSLAVMNNLEFDIEIPKQIITFDFSHSSNSLAVTENIPSTTKNDICVSSEALSVKKRSTENDDEANYAKKIKLSNANADENDYKSSEIFSSNKDCIESSRLYVESSNNASRYALYMLRQEFSQPPVTRLQHSQDYVVLRSCDLHCQIKTDPYNFSEFPFIPKEVKEKLFDDCPTYSDNEKSHLMTVEDFLSAYCSYLPEKMFYEQDIRNLLKSEYEKVSLSHAVLEDGLNIYEYIAQRRELGVTHTDLLRNFQQLKGNLMFSDHLHLLQKASIIICVGTTTLRYVSIEHCKPWVVKSLTTVDENQSSSDESSEDCRMQVEEQRLNKRKTTSYITVGVDSASNEFPCKKIKHADNFEKTYREDTSDTDTAFVANVPGIPFEEISKPICSEVNKMIDVESSKQCTAETSKKEWKEVFYLPRIWRKPDGSLNEDVFVKFSSTILSYIVSNPGISEQQICSHFTQILQPVQTLELLELLERGKYVFKYYCKSLMPKTLFSGVTDVSVMKNPDSSDSIHYESLPCAVIKMSRLKDEIHSFYKTKCST